VDPAGSVTESNENNNIVFSSAQLITITEGGQNVDLDVFGNGQEILDEAHVPTADNFTFFGDVDVGQSQDRVFTLMNDGAGTLQVLSITVAGVDSLEFVVLGDSTASIGAGESMNITLRFSPLAEGIRLGSVVIETNDIDDGTGDPSVFSFAISGAAHEPGATTPEIQIQGNGQDINDGILTAGFGTGTSFGRLRLQDAALTRTFTVFNTGDAALVISGIDIIGRNADQFVVLDDIGTIAPGESGTFRVRFDPSSLGKKIALVRVLSNDSDEGAYTFRVAGRGANNGGPGDGQAEIDVQGNSLSISDGDTSAGAADDTAFGRVRQSNQTRTRTYTIANTGNAALTIDSISLLGRDADNFIILDAVSSVAAGSTATFRVRFDPDGLGNRRADVRILSNDADEGAYTFRVRGNGVNSNVPSDGEGEITVAGLQLIDDGDTSPQFSRGTHFGTADTGTRVTRTFTITNTGSDVLNLTGPFVQITGRNAARFTIIQMPNTTLAIGEVTTFTVEFNANGAGQRRATVEILSDDTDESVFNFEILGRSRLA
jgi:hypothetical protein